jgi:hypothetical protein
VTAGFALGLVLLTAFAAWFLFYFLMRRCPPPITVPDAIARLDAVFSEMGRMYDDKLWAGVKGWAHEDLVELAVTFRAEILRLSAPDSHFRDDVRNADSVYSAPGADAKQRMLSFRGIASALRKELIAQKVD